LQTYKKGELAKAMRTEQPDLTAPCFKCDRASLWPMSHVIGFPGELLAMNKKDVPPRKLHDKALLR
jgi:hypothetical protein